MHRFNALLLAIAAGLLPAARASHHGNAFVVNHNGYGEDCEVVDNCVQTTGWDGLNDDVYETSSGLTGRNDYCSISPTRSGYLSIEAFELYDHSSCSRGHFAVGEYRYCGTYFYTSQTTGGVVPDNAPSLNGMWVDTNTVMEFDGVLDRSYSSNYFRDGFKICLTPDGSPTPQPSTNPAPTAAVPHLVQTLYGNCVSYGNCFVRVARARALLSRSGRGGSRDARHSSSCDARHSSSRRTSPPCR